MGCPNFNIKYYTEFYLQVQYTYIIFIRTTIVLLLIWVTPVSCLERTFVRQKRYGTSKGQSDLTLGPSKGSLEDRQ